MSKQTERYIVADNVTEDVKKFRVGFSMFDKLCRNSGNPVQAKLMVPTKDNIDDDSNLAAFLRRYNSRKIIDDLRGGRDVILPCGVPFSLATTQSFSDSGDPLIVLAVNVSSGMLTKIDESQNIQAVIVVPEDTSNVEEWARQWGPSAVSDY
jgi:hypothetical protein